MATDQPDDDRVGALFALPGEDFVAARDALAKDFKAAGDKEGAAATKALRRPTVAASAVNWLARDAAKELAGLVRLGERLREAHRTLADGGDSVDIRRITSDRRRRTAALADRAVQYLGAAGEAQRIAITHTLDAAVNDAESGELVRAGRLSKELDAPAGFGAEMVFAPVAPGKAKTRPPREDRRAARRARRTPSERVSEPTVVEEPAEVEIDAELEALRTSLQREADAAARVAQEAARDATSARADVAALQTELRDAEARLHAAEERARLTQWKSVAAQNDLRHAGE